MSPNPAGAGAPGQPGCDAAYSSQEQHALTLAADLRARVDRERETVRRLRAYLVEHDHRSP